MGSEREQQHDRGAALAAGNPFSTRYTRPGALPFRFEPGESEQTLIDRLRSFGWWGQIAGPHGSGKSTLIAALKPALLAAGRTAAIVNLHQGDRRLPLAAGAWHSFTAGTQLIVDGYEQLSPFARWLTQRRCRRRCTGLLVTTHRDLGLPTLIRMEPRLDVALALVAQLLPAGDAIICDRDIESAWTAERGNVREVLFAMYDLFEQRRSARPCGGLSP